jgi:hypothetical protein
MSVLISTLQQLEALKDIWVQLCDLFLCAQPVMPLLLKAHLEGVAKPWIAR